MDYTLPNTLDTIKDCSYVLNNAPGIISDLRDQVKKRQDLIDDRQAIIALENKDEKQTVIKAKQQTDEEVRAIREELRAFDALLERWEKAWASSKFFYKSLNGI